MQETNDDRSGGVPLTEESKSGGEDIEKGGVAEVVVGELAVAATSSPSASPTTAAHPANDVPADPAAEADIDTLSENPVLAPAEYLEDGESNKGRGDAEGGGEGEDVDAENSKDEAEGKVEVNAEDKVKEDKFKESTDEAQNEGDVEEVAQNVIEGETRKDGERKLEGSGIPTTLFLALDHRAIIHDEVEKLVAETGVPKTAKQLLRKYEGKEQELLKHLRTMKVCKDVREIVKRMDLSMTADQLLEEYAGREAVLLARLEISSLVASGLPQETADTLLYSYKGREDELVEMMRLERETRALVQELNLPRTADELLGAYKGREEDLIKRLRAMKAKADAEARLHDEVHELVLRLGLPKTVNELLAEYHGREEHLLEILRSTQAHIEANATTHTQIRVLVSELRLQRPADELLVAYTGREEKLLKKLQKMKKAKATEAEAKRLPSIFEEEDGSEDDSSDDDSWKDELLATSSEEDLEDDTSGKEDAGADLLDDDILKASPEDGVLEEDALVKEEAGANISEASSGSFEQGTPEQEEPGAVSERNPSPTESPSEHLMASGVATISEEQDMTVEEGTHPSKVVLPTLVDVADERTDELKGSPCKSVASSKVKETKDEAERQYEFEERSERSKIDPTQSPGTRVEASKENA